MGWKRKQRLISFFFFYSREKDETFFAGIDEDGVRQQWPAPGLSGNSCFLLKSDYRADWMVKLVDDDYFSSVLFTSTLSSTIPSAGCPHLQFLIFFFPFTWFEYTIKEDRSVDLYSRVLGMNFIGKQSVKIPIWMPMCAVCTIEKSII
jgi:hypothetical protein